MTNKSQPRIFLCHASEDKPRVEGLYHKLKEAGYHPWLDNYNLLPGVDWELEIRRAIRGSAFFLACLSEKSVDKRGYVQKEIKMGLDELDRMPEGKIYLIPVRLEECAVPGRLQSRQWVDLFEPGGFEKLKQSLDYEISELQSRHLPIVPKLIRIPAGEFLMGTSDEDIEWLVANTDWAAEWQEGGDFKDEQPAHEVYLEAFYIGKYPVTNAEYGAFVSDTGHRVPRHWKGQSPAYPISKADHPVVDVSWYDAVAYCEWLSEKTDKSYRLPTEAEWEKAARGTDGRIYPWGNEWDATRLNSNSTGAGPGDTTPVGLYSPRGDSPYGCVDMAGNVWEFCLSRYEPYPYDPKDGREDPEDEDTRVFRGGSFSVRVGVHCAVRYPYDPYYRGDIFGFRVVLAPDL